MSSKLEMKSSVLAELSVDVSAEKIQSEINKAFAALSRKAKVRGFRQGKAPRALLKRMFGEALLQDVRNDIVNDSLIEALVEHKVSPLNRPYLDAPPLIEGENYSFKAVFETRPKLESINYDGIELEKNTIVINEEEIDKEVLRLRSSMAVVEDLPNPRAAEKGDEAVISLRRFQDGKWEDTNLNDHHVVLGDNHIPPVIENTILGMNIGDEKEADMSPASDGEDADKKLLYQVKLVDLKQRTLPEPDDEFAKDIGNFETLSALRESIRDHLLASKNRMEERRLRSVLYEALMKNNPMDLPPSLVERNLEMLRQDLNKRMQNSEAADEVVKALEESTVKTAEEIVHKQLLMLEIARLAELEVKEEDIDAEIEKQAKEAGIPIPMLRAEINKNDGRENLSLQILENKIFDFAAASVKITYKEGIAVKSPNNDNLTPTSSEETKKSDNEESEDDSIETKPKAKAASKKKTTKRTADDDTAEASVEKKASAKKTATKKTTGKKTPAEK